MPSTPQSLGECLGEPVSPEPEATLQPEHLAIVEAIQQLQQQHQGDAIALLQTLRLLERLHREVVDGPFREALPNNRQALYKLLRDIEAQGGWPYIPRFRLRSLLNWLAEQEAT